MRRLLQQAVRCDLWANYPQLTRNQLCEFGERLAVGHPRLEISSVSPWSKTTGCFRFVTSVTAETDTSLAQSIIGATSKTRACYCFGVSGRFSAGLVWPR